MQEVRRGAAKHEEPGPYRPSVGQHTQDREQLGTALNLVEHDEAGERFERQHRVGQARQLARIFEIEEDRRAGSCRGHTMRQRRLAHLAWPQNRDDRMSPEQAGDPIFVEGPVEHALRYHEKSALQTEFSW